MDPRDLLRAFPDGIACTVCDQSVPVERIQLLARREDMTFVQIECGACRSTTLAFLAESPSDDAEQSERPAPRPVITSDDVIEMHRFLSDWQGDAQSLVADRDGKESRSGQSMPPR